MKVFEKQKIGDLRSIRLFGFTVFTYLRNIKYGVVSYSQDGEDVLLNSLYEDMPHYKGFYIDIGALHPKRLSNTQLFYEKGWRGINVDATPGSMNVFERMRPRDINVESPVSDRDEILTFFSFKEKALNNFDPARSANLINMGYDLEAKLELKTRRLNDILEQHLPRGQKVDFMSMDVENMECRILSAFDFEKYSPDYLLVEDLDALEGDFSKYSTSISRFLRERGYMPILKAKRTVIFGRLRQQ